MNICRPHDCKTSNFKPRIEIAAKYTIYINALTTVGALMTLIDFTLSNARRFYSSMENPLAVNGLMKGQEGP